MEIKKVTTKTQSEHLEIIKNLKKTKDNLVPKWISNRAFYEGHHFTMGELDKNGNPVRVTGKRPYREIPLATHQIDGMRNMLLSNKPSPYVYPDDRVFQQGELTDEEFRVAVEREVNAWGKAIEHLLDEEIKLPTILKKLIKYVLLYSTAYLQVYHDGKKYCIEALDVFEVSIYATISKIKDYPYLVKHIAKPISALKLDDRYDEETIKELETYLQENRYFADENKNSLYVGKYGYSDPKTVVIDELYALERDGLAVYTYVNDQLIKAQSPEETKLKCIPFAMVLSGDEPYEASMIEKFIPLNKTIDILITKLERRIKRLDGGRLAVQSSEPIKIIRNNDGEFVRYKRSAPTPLPEENYPATIVNLVGILRDLFSELGVNAAISSSSIPNGIEAWRAIESLKQSDYGKMENLTQNIAEGLTEITERLIELVAVTQTTPMNIITVNDKERFTIVGAAGEDIAPEGALIFNPNKKLKVVIESAITHTPDARRELVIQMVTAGILPKETAIEMLKIGNTREIVSKLNEEMVAGKSIVDMPDFQLLPKQLQIAIVQFLQSGAPQEIAAEIDMPEATPQQQ